MSSYIYMELVVINLKLTSMLSSIVSDPMTA